MKKAQIGLLALCLLLPLHIAKVRVVAAHHRRLAAVRRQTRLVGEMCDDLEERPGRQDLRPLCEGSLRRIALR